MRLLALLLLQPERSWALRDLAETLKAPDSSVHRELGRAEAAGLLRRDATARPHRFSAATDDPLYEPLATLLRRSVGVETNLRDALARRDVAAAVIFGSWPNGTRRPDSDIDVLVVGDADLRDLRGAVRSIGRTAGRTIDLTLVSEDEFRHAVESGSSFARKVLDSPTTPLVGDLARLARP